ncbi:hypothetical protein H3C61_02560 [Candidatus Gracilibacteria bacterium]|nr:hypothetical protein [Candidatus Gracilibacteria bacterium]
MKNNIDFLQNELIRISEWLRFIEQKLILLSAYYGLGISYIAQNIQDIKRIFQENSCIKIFIFLYFIFTLILGIYFLFRVIFPNFKNNSNNKSFFFFRHISNMKILDYVKDFQILTIKEKENQILEQIHINSTIANEKMNNIAYAFKILFINLLFFFITLFTI